jgi:hypothetical protein
MVDTSDNDTLSYGYPNEIEITPAMVEAGVSVFLEFEQQI